MAALRAPGALPVETLFRAFADRTRLRLLCLLRHGERCVGDLADALGVEQPSASRHLAYLRRAGLVAARKAGPWSYYALAPAGDALRRGLLAALDGCAAALPEADDDLARLRALRQQGGCCPP